ncbi:unnamed protein product (macronuclear) [Paramecium tetraurelia]|uniref:CBM20 domain-containing protein n=1 Tax=Paramecium tetraurelia TaxID=5888 RepID=A0BWK3_PARTE|nr:uncharacterized protein GSPATT00032772001 [Paramecium tetraurelia]CAK62920.1 unnamed protein product [Paramecium tetraurelia]|eukprot:XP_001430318.1 hypothetical protein (macronuclear) [Paramecium tetraurelia strain d4-2]
MNTECSVLFHVTVRTTLSQVVGVIGNQEELGSWNEKCLCILKTDPQIFPKWVAEKPIAFKQGTKLEFKFVILDNGTAIWEELPQNRKYRCRYWKVILTADWNNYEGKEYIEKRFKSSVCLDQEILSQYTKPRLSDQFDPFNQANDDSEDSVDGFDSFAKEIANRNDSESSESEEDKKKPTVELNKDSEFSSLYQLYTENPKFRQLKNFSQNDILYEINDDPLIGLSDEDSLLISTYYLPIVIIKQTDGSYQRSNFQHSFSLHLLFGVQQFKRIWFGLPIVLNELGEKITDQSVELKNYLKQFGFVPVFVNQECLDYFNKEFCSKLYQAIMNNDVSITKLAALEYSDYMQECFKKLNDEFFQEIKPHINQHSIALIADYRLLYLSQIFVNHKFTRLPLVIFYNRLFPHLDNLKLIPFFHEIINSFLHANVICFSNYKTANEFLTVMKDIYKVEYHSFKGNLAFHYYGREILVKLQNPGIELTACGEKRYEIGELHYDKVENDNEIKIVGVDTYGHQSGVELKFRHLLKFIKETDIIQKNPHIKYIQILLKAFEDHDINEQRVSLLNQIEQINSYLYPNRDNYFVKLIEEEMDSKHRFKVFEKAKIYLQCKYSGRHDFYLSEYIHLNKMPIALISDSSCYHRGFQSIVTFNVFSHIDFKEKFADLLIKVINKQYQFTQLHKLKVEKDQLIIRQNQTSQWIENIFIDAKKAVSMLKFAQISLRFQDGLMIKVAHNLKFQHLDIQSVAKAYQQSTKPIIIIEFETIVTDQYFIDYKPKHFLQQSPHLKGNEEAVMIRQVEQELLNRIKELSKTNKVYIVSGGLFNELSSIFSGYNISLFAENGFLYKSDQLQWNALFNLDYQCLIQVRKIFNQYAMKTEGALIESKESSISLKLMNSDEYVQQLIQDLVENVQMIVDRYPTFQLIIGSHSVEVSPKNLNKGMILEIIMQKENLQRGKLDFALIIARGIQNEDIFSHFKVITQSRKYFSENASLFSVSQGLMPSYANYYLNNQQELIQLFKTI